MKHRLAPLLEGMEMGKSEHDWLEQRLESMTAKEELLFRGAMQIESPRDIQTTIKILQGLDHYQLLYGAEDDVLLGRFVMEHIHTPTHAARGYLDPEIVGAAYREHGSGSFVENHYVERLNPDRPLPEGNPNVPLPITGEYAIRVKLVSRNNMEGVWIGFPDTGEYMDTAHPDELLLGLDALQAETLDQCMAVDVDCALPQITDILNQYDSAGELVRHAIDFGYVWAEQGQGAPHWLDKWQAVLELIAENDPMLNSYLRGTQAYYDGRRVLIECSDDFRDFMRRSKETSKNIKQYIYQVTHIKCGIGPYEKTAAAVSNAPAADVEETLRQMKDLGVDVVVEDK